MGHPSFVSSKPLDEGSACNHDQFKQPATTIEWLLAAFLESAMRHVTGHPIRLSILLTIVGLVAASCGGSGKTASPAKPRHSQAPSTSPAARPAPISYPLACKPKGTSLAIAASHDKFSTKCLAAPAKQAFTIRFDNKDSAENAPLGPEHNLSIYTDSTQTDQVFRGKAVIDKTVTYHVGALPRGTYFFQCDIHSQAMTGKLVIP